MKAARKLARDFGEVENLQASQKGPADFVSAADRRSEEIIRQELEQARPGYSFLMKGPGATKGTDSQHRWIVDPLEGMTNFLHGIPLFCISIALERQGRLQAGIIYNPISDELFSAERGSGAFLNDRRIRVSARTQISEAVIATGIAHRGRGDHGAFLKDLASVMAVTAGVRRCGGAALDLAWLAAGRFDGFWESGLSAWDVAAGALILREAGGFISDGKGGDQILDAGTILAGNTAIHRHLLGMIKT